MQMLQRNQQKWRRKRLLSHRTTSDSGLRWTPRTMMSGGGAEGRRQPPIISSDDDGDDDHRSSSKENDVGAAHRANGGAPSTPSRKGGRGGGGSSSSSTRHPGGKPSSRTPRRIYVDLPTLRAMRAEVEDLPLPSTLSVVCLALRTSRAVLDAHADADGSLPSGDDDGEMKSLEIMGAHMRSMSLAEDPSSPIERRDRRAEKFRGACRSLVSGGNKVMLSSWEEVEGELSRVFLFAAVDIKVASGADCSQRDATGIIPTFSRRGHPVKSPPKRAPKRAQRFSPKKPRHSMRTSGVIAAVTNKGFLTIEAFREQIRQKVGYSKFQQIVQQAEILPEKPSISSYEEEAKRLDEQIQQKESQRRSTQRADEIIAEREKADKEREARDAATKLMRPLTPDEQKIVNSAIRGIGPHEDILASHEADSVQRGSMQTLFPGQWLNDEIINYFLKNCLANRDEKLCARNPGRRRSHFFNSFFVQTMFDEKNNNGNLRGRYNYKNVKRWSKKVPGKDIFNLKYVVCPINLDNTHWTSAVIFVEEKRIQYYDSMGGTDRAKLQGLLQYLKDEHKAKKGVELDVGEWTLVDCTRDTPSQRNGYDCGVFTCMFCDFISKDCPLVFNQDHISQCRERIALSIMKNCAIE